MILTRRQIDLLDALVKQAPHSQDGLDAARFRASHEDDLDALDDLERRQFLHRTDKNAYAIRIPALAATRDRNPRAEKSLFLAEQLFDFLRREYKVEPGRRWPLSEMAHAMDLPVGDIRRGVFVLITTSIWANRSTNLDDADAYVTPGEGVLKYKTFESLITEILRWTDPVSDLRPRREKQQKFGILDSPTLLTSDLQQQSGVFGTALVYLDLDNFKAINTHLTEVVVDEVVLPPLHALLGAQADSIGHAYAEGGDEFIFLLPNFSEQMAVAFAEEVRRHIEAVRLKGPAAAIRLSASLGVAHATQTADLSDIRKRANEAKRFVKQHGKNGIAVWRVSAPEIIADDKAPNSAAYSSPLLPRAPEDPERDLVKGFTKAVLKRERSPENAQLLLATLRDEGTEIRNHPFTLDHMLTDELDAWIEKIQTWTAEAIDALKLLSPADAKWLATLRNVPEPTVSVPNIRLGGAEDRRKYLKAFCEHDCRLDRFEKLCTKHGVGA
jgi:diguanylate cyclase (GGDEF)-like protein